MLRTEASTLIWIDSSVLAVAENSFVKERFRYTTTMNSLLIILILVDESVIFLCLVRESHLLY
jgi:hypothetical protein